MPFKINIFKHKTAWYDRAIFYLICLLVVMLPLVFCTSFQTVFSMPKLIVLELSISLIGLLWLYKIFNEGKFVYCKNRFNLALLAFAVVCILNTAFSTSVFTSIFGAEGRFTGLVLMLSLMLLSFFVFNWIRTEQDLWGVIKTTVFTSSTLALYGLIQFFGLFQEGFNWSENPGERVFGTIGHADHFGPYLGMNIVLSLFLVDRLGKIEKHKVWQAAAVIGVVLQLSALGLTASRGAAVALCVALAYLTVVLVKNNFEKSRQFLKKYLWHFIAVLVLIITLFLLAAFQVIKFSMFDRIVNNIVFIQEGHLPDRFSWWLSSLEMIKQRPLLGFGLATFRDAFNAFRRPDFVTQAPGDMQDLITPEAAHNEYLNIAATQGVLGLLAFLALIYFAFKGSRQKQNQLNLTALALKGAIIVYLVQIVFNFGVITTLSFFFIFLGLLASVNDVKKHPVEIKLHSAVKHFFLFLGLVVICSIGYVTFRQASADYYYRAAEIAVSQKKYDQAIIAYQKTLLFQPFEYAYYQSFADFALKSSTDRNLQNDTRLKFLNLAQIEYRRAVALNPYHPSTFYNLGLAEMQIYLSTGDQKALTSAIADFNQSISLSPNNPLYSYQSAQALLTAKDPTAKEEAVKALQNVIKIRPGFRDAEKLLYSI